MKFLLRRVIALRGHSENEGNLPQLLSAWTVNSAILKHWVKEGRLSGVAARIRQDVPQALPVHGKNWGSRMWQLWRTRRVNLKYYPNNVA